MIPLDDFEEVGRCFYELRDSNLTSREFYSISEGDCADASPDLSLVTPIDLICVSFVSRVGFHVDVLSFQLQEVLVNVVIPWV